MRFVACYFGVCFCGLVVSLSVCLGPRFSLSLVTSADRLVGECTPTSNVNQCHWPCIRQNCGFQAYPCFEPGTYDCSAHVGDEFTPQVSPAECHTPPASQEDKNCNLICVEFSAYNCKIKSGSPNDAECEDGRVRCPIEEFKKPGDDGAPTVKVRVEGAGSKKCTNAPSSDGPTPATKDMYRCPGA